MSLSLGIACQRWHRRLDRMQAQWRTAGMGGVARLGGEALSMLWAAVWMRYAGMGLGGRCATRMATLFVGPYKSRYFLAGLNPKGYVAPTATIRHGDVRMGANIFISDRVLIFQHGNGGPVELGDRACLLDETIIEVGAGGSLIIGSNTCIQPRCQFAAFKESIQIGRGVQIAPYCAFYNYDHTFKAGELISRQPLQSKGGIVIDDDAWLGVGVTVLAGVKIGKGAVIGARAVVTHDVPDGAIAAGNPARILKMRDDV